MRPRNRKIENGFIESRNRFFGGKQNLRPRKTSCSNAPLEMKRKGFLPKRERIWKTRNAAPTNSKRNSKFAGDSAGNAVGIQEKERLEKVAEATDFIRETLKKSAPLVARNYVYHVSLEANQMFREISGNAERTLKWTEDYGIILEEFGHERPFVNLSGGEQMAAAFRSTRSFETIIRCAARIFRRTDDQYGCGAPRTSRRTNQPHHRKTNFDQLFVISHDDTFEGYADNVISVGGNTNG